MRSCSKSCNLRSDELNFRANKEGVGGGDGVKKGYKRRRLENKLFISKNGIFTEKPLFVSNTNERRARRRKEGGGGVEEG